MSVQMGIALGLVSLGVLFVVVKASQFGFLKLKTWWQKREAEKAIERAEGHKLGIDLEPENKAGIVSSVTSLVQSVFSGLYNGISSVGSSITSGVSSIGSSIKGLFSSEKTSTTTSNTTSITTSTPEVEVVTEVNITDLNVTATITGAPAVPEDATELTGGWPPAESSQPPLTGLRSADSSTSPDSAKVEESTPEAQSSPSPSSPFSPALGPVINKKGTIFEALTKNPARLLTFRKPSKGSQSSSAEEVSPVVGKTKKTSRKTYKQGND